jgi:hypothetical protein
MAARIKMSSSSNFRTYAILVTARTATVMNDVDRRTQTMISSGGDLSVSVITSWSIAFLTMDVDLKIDGKRQGTSVMKVYFR